MANAGWYTMPDDSKVFPYGLRGVPQDEEGLADSYSATSRSSSVRTTSTPMTDCCGTTPGVTRRGPIDSNADLSFYLTARKSAEEHSLTFRWHLRVVPGIVHDHTAMARAAAPILFGRSE